MGAKREGGAFTSLNDFVWRLQSHLNKQSFESLIKSGALYLFGHPSHAIMMVSGEVA